MAGAWLPYAASARGSPPMERPPAFSLRPAVAIPLLPASALGLAILWLAPGWTVPSPSEPPPVVAPSSPIPLTPALQVPEPVNRWGSEIELWSKDFSLPPELIAVVMTIESCGDPTAISRAGAQGLFQVMPFHFQTGEESLDPETNAARGLAYLRRALELSSGDVGLALAGYNGGHGLISRDPSAWPAETVRYVHWGTTILDDLHTGRSPSPALQAWLDAGGAHLCRRAMAARSS